MVAAFAVCAVLQGAESMHLATAQRELHTRMLTQLELISQFSGMLVTIVLALITRSVWSLVIGTLISTFSRTILSHRFLPGPDYRICWDKSCAAEIVSFGKWIFLSSIIGFAASNGEKLILGGTLPAAAFGTFSIAALLLAAISGLIGNLNAHLVFPSLSEALRSSDAAARRVYARMQQVADGILGVIAGTTFVAGGWVVHLLYDVRYSEAAWMLQFLGLGLLAIRYQVLEQMMFAHGKPVWVTVSNALRATSLIVFVPLGYLWAGERGAVIAVVASQFVGWPVSITFKIRSQLMQWQSEVIWPFSLVAGTAIGWVLDKVMLNWSVTRAIHILAP
jgi:O-antigen/teichoic acid export membrane protein